VSAVKVADAFGKEIARSGDGNADEEDEHRYAPLPTPQVFPSPV
jgi:hypothetical protein